MDQHVPPGAFLLCWWQPDPSFTAMKPNEAAITHSNQSGAQKPASPKRPGLGSAPLSSSANGEGFLAAPGTDGNDAEQEQSNGMCQETAIRVELLHSQVNRNPTGPFSPSSKSS